ncbi:hypothetical protein C8J56DRAFT_982554 [Mycena floridula]|nr:hypothetical protein C8J56DRAFT_982554 [Mycena floridula]
MPRLLAYPPLDGSSFLHDIPDFHLEHNGDHVFYTWKDAQTEDVHELTHSQFARAVHRAATFFDSQHLDHSSPIAVIALCDTILYHAMFVGLMRAGYVPYLISPRNSPAATAKLMTDVNCSQILTTSSTLTDFVHETREYLKQSDHHLRVYEIPQTQDIFPTLGESSRPDSFHTYKANQVTVSLSDIAFYLHSSGSTGFPKTIPQTHQSILQWASFYCISDLRLHRPALRISATMLPSFHTLGIYFQLLVPLAALCVVNIAPPICPSVGTLPYLASPASALDHARTTDCNSLVTIPALIEIWASNADSVAFLRQLSLVWFSGGTLAPHVGDKLTKSGVVICSVYGGTEFGAPVHTVPRAKDIADGDWSYIRFDSCASIRWNPYGNDLYEAVFLASESHRPGILNLPNDEGYATSDLFSRHPAKDMWKIISRSDDVIVLSSGEKFVPGPTEDLISSSPLISTCLMFGREQHQVGIVIQPKEPVDWDDQSTFKDKIHHIIEEANHQNPGFARIFPDMILVTSPGKPLPRNAKGALNRRAALVEFAPEITDLYEAVKSGQSTPAISGLCPGFTRAELSMWLSRQASQLSDMPIRPDVDLFEQGFDSIAVASLRQRILSLATELQLWFVDKISMDWIYQHPSIDAIAYALFDSGESSAITIQSMLNKYSKQLVRKTPKGHSFSRVRGCDVVLTGSTGSLGSRILALLIRRLEVKNIYCLNRAHAGGTSLLERHKSSFVKLGLDTHLLQSPKIHFILANLVERDLGIDSDVMKQIQASSFMIIHVAWRLDFNLTLASFEPQIKGTTNLINFASNCERFLGFLFTSSISSAQGWPCPATLVPEEFIHDLTVAEGKGYGESKYIVERLLEMSDMPSVCFRIGQICGGHSGAWSTGEWFPMLLKTSISLKMIPDLDGVVSWIPSDETADIIVDTCFRPHQSSRSIVNLVHPKPVKWSDIATWLIQAVNEPNISRVDPNRWRERLRLEAEVKSDSQLSNLPALKLLQFFEGLTQENTSTEIGGLPTFSVSKEGLVGALKPLSFSDVQRWVSYWRSIGFI